MVLPSNSDFVGEMPPGPPISFFGRDELIDEVIELAENLKPIALIGAGGIGKTSIALSVLHHDRIEKLFGHNRRFIRCDEFPTSRAHFLARLSEVIGAGVENPQNLASLRPCLSSNKVFIIIDNAESTLDPQGASAREIYAIVHQLCQIKTVCLLITSRIRTVPPHCTRPEIPTLSMEAACDIFYDIYGDHDGRSDVINDLLRHLDFHALSITLLATTASHNDWSHGRLAKEWKTHRAQVLRTDYNESLAASIDLSLNSPTFSKLGPHARGLLEVVAFFPQGVDEENLDQFFPTILDRQNIFDKFCVLSLTYRNDNFITMLAPLRDHLCPQDQKSHLLLCAAKDHYLTRLSIDLPSPEAPGFEEAQWIKSEDVNVEHLLDVFTSIDATSGDIWDACHHFLAHLYWHKPRETVLTEKIEGLPEDHPLKPQCLVILAELFEAVGNPTKRKRLLIHCLKLRRQQGSGHAVAQTLRRLADANRRLRLYGEGIEQAEEASEIFGQLGDTIAQAKCLEDLAYLFLDDGQLDAAEDATSRMVDLIPGKSQQYLTCRSSCILGDIYRSKGEKDKALHHLETALGIASSLNLQNQLYWAHYTLARLFRDEGDFDQANAHIGQAKSCAIDHPYNLACAMGKQADIWCLQGRLEDAISEARRTIEAFEKLGDGAQYYRNFLRELNERRETSEGISGGEPPESILHLQPV